MTLIWSPDHEKPIAPATFRGIQKGFGSVPDCELWNLEEDIPGHPAGSTVSRQTIERAGYRIRENAR